MRSATRSATCSRLRKKAGSPFDGLKIHDHTCLARFKPRRPHACASGYVTGSTKHEKKFASDHLRAA